MGSSLHPGGNWDCILIASDRRVTACGARRATAGFNPTIRTMKNAESFLLEHQELTRRYFIRMGATGAAALGLWPASIRGEAPAPELAKAIEALEPYFTAQEDFRDVSRG